MKAANQTLETNCRPASPLEVQRQFGRAVHARPCLSGGGRSPLALDNSASAVCNAVVKVL